MQFNDPDCRAGANESSLNEHRAGREVRFLGPPGAAVVAARATRVTEGGVEARSVAPVAVAFWRKRDTSTVETGLQGFAAVRPGAGCATPRALRQAWPLM